MVPKDDSTIFFVLPEEEGVRLDTWLKTKFPSFSRTYFQQLIEEGCVLLNGEPVKKRVCPEEGDEIEVCFQAIPSASLMPEEIPLEILYEDEHLLAVNKPSGMVVHPAPGNWSHTFVNALLFYCQGKLPGKDPIRPGIVHRLDKETSGVLLAAKTNAAQQQLVEAFSQRKIDKLYLALVKGNPPNGTFSFPIGRHPVHRKEMAILPDGKEAISEIQTAAFDEKIALVIIRPKTGRTHQIRVHLKHLGTPVLGDPLYGNLSLNEALKIPRLFLHAYRLNFSHPITQENICITAPIPNDMKETIASFSTRAFSLAQ